MAFNYFKRRNELKNSAVSWSNLMETAMKDNIAKSVKGTVHYKEDFAVDKIVPRFNTTTIMCINAYSQDTAYATGKQVEGKSAILNFASYKNPGGKFLEGSSAQEESLCHRSTLYNVLVKFTTSFYKDNLKKLNNSLYNDNMLYSPNIYFTKEDGNINYNDFVACDVITCAAPNKTAALKYKRANSEEITDALISRIDHILAVAYDQKVDNLILGAFGCGVFGNDPTTVASIFAAFIEDKYFGCFKNVIYAIPKMSETDHTIDYFNTILFRHADNAKIIAKANTFKSIELTEPIRETKLMKNEKYNLADVTIDKLKKNIRERKVK